MLRVTADLEHPLAKRRKGRRQVGTGGGLADAALAVDRKDLRAFDLHVGVLMHLHRSVAVQPLQHGRG